MVRQSLIRDAQRFTTGAEIHNTNQFIAMYRGAAKHTCSDPTCQQCAATSLFEQNLERHVAQLRGRRR